MLFHSLAVILSSVNLSSRAWDYAAEYQGNTNPEKKSANLLFPPATPPCPLPLISHLRSTRRPKRVGLMLPGLSPSYQTTQRWWHRSSQCRKSMYPRTALKCDNKSRKTTKTSWVLRGTNHNSMGVAGHIKPRRAADVKHHHRRYRYQIIRA